MAALPDELAFRPSESSAELLGDALSSLHLSGALFLRAEFTSPWALETSEGDTFAAMLVPGAHRVILFHVVLEGRLVVSIGGVEEELGPGDVAILPYADKHVLRSPARTRPVRLAGLLPPHPWRRLPALCHGGGGARTSIACGHLYSDDLELSPVLAAMPELIVVRPEHAAFREWLMTNVRFALTETEERAGAHDVLMQRLPELLFLKCLDTYARKHAHESTGWLAAAADPIVGRALAAMHRQPSESWTLAKLSHACRTSRSVLDERFRRLLGCAPMRYLTSFRLQLAGRKLCTSNESVGGIAEEIGYDTVASFSRAFKRHSGVSPQLFRARAVFSTLVPTLGSMAEGEARAMENLIPVSDPARDPKAVERARAQVVELKKMYEETKAARAERQRQKPLFDRLGGRAPITAVVRDIVELHFTEPLTKPLTKGVDKERLVTLVVEWLCQAAGGNVTYTGRDMVSAHAHLNMTEVHFMAAGDQIMRSLKKHGVPEPEIQEVMCAIIGHHDDVIR